MPPTPPHQARLSRWSDDQLLRRLGQGDVQPALELHRRYAPHLQAHARHLGVHDPATAVVDAFAEVARHAHCFPRGRLGARAWLLLLVDRHLRGTPPAPGIMAARPEPLN